jgi:diadenosine tetraphosphate (Ap4A) HIT family hydrolase
MDCIFCKIASKEVEAYVVLEDEHHIAFLSIYPNTDGVTVVVPKKHYDSYGFDAPNTVLCKLIDFSKKVAKYLDRAFDDVARTGMVLEGYGINHLHVKLYPLHGTIDDGNWKPIKSTNRVFFTKYDGFISSNDSFEASKEKLIEVQNKILFAIEHDEQ